MNIPMLGKYNASMKREPFSGLRESAGSYNLLSSDIFSDIFGDVFSTLKPYQASRVKVPYQASRVNVTDAEMTASFDLPGVRPEDIEVSVMDQKLSISYTLRGEKSLQTFNIHNDYDGSASSAKIENGVLELRFPKINRMKGKKINIEVK